LTIYIALHSYLVSLHYDQHKTTVFRTLSNEKMNMCVRNMWNIHVYRSILYQEMVLLHVAALLYVILTERKTYSSRERKC